METIHLGSLASDRMEQVDRIGKSGEAAKLQIDGAPSLIILSADKYNELIELLEDVESGLIVRERLVGYLAGEPGIPGGEALAMLRQRYEKG